jgi:hypothetical protein
MRMRALALLVIVAVLFRAGPAPATESRRSVDAANAALSATPPDREAARAALARATTAGDDAEAVAEAFLLAGTLDEDDDAFVRAIQDYRAATSAAPHSRAGLRALGRIDWLSARSEGDFAPLGRLERVRRSSPLSSDPGEIESLAREAEAFPPGTVRVEARMLVAEAWLGRMHRSEAALPLLRAVADDPRADALTARLAERELVDTLAALGRVDEAAAEARLHANRLDPRFVRQVARLLVRRALRYGALAVLGLFVVLASAALARAGQRGRLGDVRRALRKIAPVALLFAFFVAVGGGILASNYESGNAAPFLMLGGAVLPLVLLARAWGVAGSARTAARVGRALLCSAAVPAAAFVLLEETNPLYLAGFGL